MFRFEDLVARLPEAPSRDAKAPLALQGIRVIDFTHFIAGPFATMMLADFGADVIKIEAPGSGDDFRRYPPTDPAMPAQGAPFFFANRNKRSVALDLKQPCAQDTARALIAQADVVVENFSTGVMARLGLDAATCRALNPGLVYCSIPAYARDGALADRPGFDPVVQAESGYISMNGYADRDGVRSLSPVMDMGTSLITCSTILAALMARHGTGQGQYCEVALFDSAIAMLAYAPLQYLFAGMAPQRNGNISPDTSPSGVFDCSDGSFYINCGNDRIFGRLATDVLGMPALLEDPRFRTPAERVRHRDALLAALTAEFVRQPWSHWQPRLRAASVPSGQVRTLPQALASREVAERGLLTRIPHPVAGWIPNITPASRLAATPVADPRPAPAVGQHTEEVLRELLGHDDAHLAALRSGGAFGQTT